MEQELPAPTAAKSPVERKATLAQAIASWVRGGWMVESQTDFQAVMAKGHRPNHVLHLILTLITLGIWAIAWILVAILGGEKRKVVSWTSSGTYSQKARTRATSVRANARLAVHALPPCSQSQQRHRGTVGGGRASVRRVGGGA
jgi:hypothetical protein